MIRWMVRTVRRRARLKDRNGGVFAYLEQTDKFDLALNH